LNVEMRADIAVKLGHPAQPDRLQVEHDLRHILTDGRDRGKFVPDVLDSNSRYRASLQRSQEDAAKRVSKCCPVAGLERLDPVAPVVEPRLDRFYCEFGLLQQADSPPRV